MPDTIISTVVKTLKAKPPLGEEFSGREMNGREQLQNWKVGNTRFHSQSDGSQGPGVTASAQGIEEVSGR